LLQTIILYKCRGITDVGLYALGRGCGQLQTIDLRYCGGISDIGLSALDRGCGQLQVIDLSGCSITDIGLSALGRGCGQLQTIDLSDCKGITDIGLPALCDGCGLLQTVDLNHCRCISGSRMWSATYGQSRRLSGQHRYRSISTFSRMWSISDSLVVRISRISIYHQLVEDVVTCRQFSYVNVKTSPLLEHQHCVTDVVSCP
jgi:Leucine Rich repeat